MNMCAFTFADLRGLSNFFSRAPDWLRSGNKGGAAPLKRRLFVFPVNRMLFQN